MKTTSLFVMLALFLFGAYIGYNPSAFTPTVQASGVQFIPLEKPTMPLCFDLDLNTSKLSVTNAENAQVNVTIKNKDVETRPEYVTIVEKEEVYIEDIAKSTRLLNRLMPIEQPKLFY